MNTEYNDEIEDVHFEDEMEMMEEIYDQEESKGFEEVQTTDQSFSKYKRPFIDLQTIEDFDQDIMVLDIDYTVQYHKRNTHDKQAVLRIYGLNKQKNTFMINVYNFLSYLYIQCPLGFDHTNQDNLEQLRRYLDRKASQAKNTFGVTNNLVIDVEPVQKESMLHFKEIGDRSSTYLKISVIIPSVVRQLRVSFEQGLEFQGVIFPDTTCESNMLYPLRFMIDKDIKGMGWITLPKNSFKRVYNTQSTCQVELDINHDKIIVRDVNEKEWGLIAPLRILSFDIECAAEKGFPKPERDPVITIGCVGKSHDTKKEDLRLVFQLKSCSEIVNCDLRTFENERDLLLAFDKFIKEYDPDVITGYNIVAFDLTYVIKRAAALQIKNYPYWGRLKKIQTVIKKGRYQSKQMGNREREDINIEGRIQLDMLIIMHQNHKLSSYSLNNVSLMFLKEQKEDVHHSIIKILQKKDKDSRKRIATYCLKDAYLPIRLVDNQKTIYNLVEMARVTGVPVSVLMKRGQQIKVLSQLYRKANAEQMIVPVLRIKKSPGGIGFVGADVLDPKTGFYDKHPVATLDFASLYPSIMIAHNLCYTTLIPQTEVHKYDPKDYTKTPTNPPSYFAKKHKREGLLARVLQELLGARTKAKKLLKEAKIALANAKTEEEKSEFENLIGVYNGRQLALKISANSVYGFTGAQVGALPCLEIAGSVTAFGRDMIMNTKRLVEEKYNKKNGFDHDAVVIYGDTDSVMIKFGCEDVAESLKLGNLAASEITKTFIQPIRLEFEKVYFPYLLLSKKRYAGMLYTSAEKPDYRDVKGMENIRRDNCLLIRQCLTKTLDILLIKRSVEMAKQYVKNTIHDLLNNRVDMSYLVITKGLTKDLDAVGDKGYKVNSAHVTLAKKLRIRNPEYEPQIGDRIPYVMIKKHKKFKAHECAEDPVYAMENDLPIDREYYLEKQIRKPITRIFQPIVEQTRDSSLIFELFEGDHTMSVTAQRINKNSMMGSFFTKNVVCMHSQRHLPKGVNRAVCKEYEQYAIDHYIKRIYKLKALQQEFGNLWTECQRCQGTTHQEIICSNNDCPIFYRRTKVRKDLLDATKEIQRFAEQ